MAYLSKKQREIVSKQAAAKAALEKLISKKDAPAEEIKAATLRLDNANKAVEDMRESPDDGNNPQQHSGQELNNHDGGNVTMSNNIKFYTKASAADFVKDHTPSSENEQGLHIGAYIRGAITGNWAGAEKEKSQFQSLATAGGTVVIPQELSAQILAQVMNKSLFYGIVPVTTMTSDNLTIAKVTSGPKVGFAAEGELAPGMSFDSTKGIYSATDMTFEGVQLKSKTVRGIAKISNELLSSAANLDQAVIDAFSTGLADAIDKAAIYGNGANNTLVGVVNTTGINNLSKAADNYYIPYVKAIGAIRAANGEPSVWGLNAATDTTLNSLLAGDNNPLEAPPVVAGLTRTISNNLRSTLAADGTTSGEGNKTYSESLIYDPKAMVFGQQMGVNFNVSNVALDALGTNCTYFAICSYIDFAVLQPSSVSRIYGI
jgi:HK97 family phage major capsid protein